MFLGRDIDFVVFYNSRNIRRKSPGDVILSYRHFCDKIGPEKASRCALVMHTAPVDQNGTDLNAVVEALDTDYLNVFFSSNKLTPQQMNALYNIADVTMLISSNEGWGLSLTESMMAGTPIIANTTGGMQDQMRFVDEDGKWIDFNKEFQSNHKGKYKECGNWARPVFPSNISLIGSVPTPYIYDERCSPEDVADAIKYWYDMDKDTRKKYGKEARSWVTSKESGMSVKNMCNNIIESIDTVLEK
jgi:glycosyltransferase involved in cell wall biosynthesis